MKYLIVNFLPGSGGNFFSRCLNLLTNAYCFGRPNGDLPTDLDHKLKMLSYDAVLNRKSIDIDWIEFEKSLVRHNSLINHADLPTDSYSIWYGHPTTQIGCVDGRDLAGPDDSIFNFYIDPSQCFEWACMNALYKNSFLQLEWFVNGKKLLENPCIHKINLAAFIMSWKAFLSEFEIVMDIIGHDLSHQETQAIKLLHCQWQTTILETKDIARFKKNIGFYM